MIFTYKVTSFKFFKFQTTSQVQNDHYYLKFLFFTYQIIFTLIIYFLYFSIYIYIYRVMSSLNLHKTSFAGEDVP